MAETLTRRQPQIVQYSLALKQPVNVGRSRGRAIQSATSVNQVLLTIENGEFSFHLFPGTLQAISQAQVRGDRLQIPKDLQNSWLMYALLEESVVHTKQGKQHKVVHLQSGLTFQSYWHEAIATEPVAQEQVTKVIRTVISLDGDILNQISQDCMRHPRGLDMVAAHYWLMDQFLQRNYSSIAHLINLIVVAFPTTVIGWNILANLGSPDPITPIFKSLLSLAVPVLWNLTQDWLLPPLQVRLKRWIWRELVGSNRMLRGLAQWILRHS